MGKTGVVAKKKGMSKILSSAKKVKTFDLKGWKEAQKQTAMTSEQFKKFQIGQKEKWPQPHYMAQPHPEGKGHTCYRDETFEIVTRWKADTKIAYRQHAKAPGTKSHVRYEKYQKAKTVGEALRLGSWPADWCWDYERGFIKVLGNVRDEPVDITSVTDEAIHKFTDVDRAVFQWYRKELCKKLGVTLEDLIEGKGSQESTLMRAHRLASQREAKKILVSAQKEKRQITDAELTRVLKEWGFGKNPNRVNVMKPGQTWVWSDNLGLTRDRQGDIHVTQATEIYPEVVQVISKWFTDRLPAEAKDFKFTSLNVNKDYAAFIHRDGNNLGPSMISAFGDFTGGSLNYYPEDDASQKDLTKLGGELTPVKLDLKAGLAMFNGNCAHSVDDFEGNRFSIVYFTIGCHAKMKDADKVKLRGLGLRVPAVDEDPYTILRPPLGRQNRKTAIKMLPRHKKMPGHKYWLKKDLSKKKRT
jgi:hypothetical protein